MRITANRDLCIGAGQCALTVPAIFTQDEDDGLVVLATAEPAQDELDATRAAIRSCPSGAIRLADD